jgi:hypothetical protein
MSNDFIVSAHALERFEERLPALYQDDQQAAQFIHRECESALAEGRCGKLAPLELSHYDSTLWKANKGLVVWVRSKVRGYVLLDTEEGRVVTTVLVGRDAEEARTRHHNRRWRKRA